MIVFLLASGYGLWRASLANNGLAFLGFLAPAILAMIVLPILFYRLLALVNSSYALEREGIRLRWGLRVEDIPIDQVQWVRKEQQLKHSLPRPAWIWPGGVVGRRRMPDGRIVEYMAEWAKKLVLIATAERVFAISPADQDEFLLAYQRLNELGSLSPISPRSVYPAFLLMSFRSDSPARLLLLSGLLIAVSLFAVVAISIPETPQVALRFTADGRPGEYVPSVRLFLIPVINTLFWISDSLIGLFFYRRPEFHSLAYLLWGSGLVTGGLFLAAVIFILSFA